MIRMLLVALWGGIGLASAAAQTTVEAQTVVKPQAAVEPQTAGSDSGRSVPYGASITWVNQPSKRTPSFPPGGSHQTFDSGLAGQPVGYCVYLPPEYDAEPDRRFPVIYNLHGNGGNEFTSVNVIRLLHQQIESGQVPPMIMVCFNGGHSTFYKNSADGKFPIESIFIDEFLPHVDSTYRTIADRGARCIEGFSMGGRGATRLAMKYPDRFGSLFCQAGNVPPLLERFDEMNEDERAASLLGTDRNRWAADDVYAVTTKNAGEIRGKVRIQIACGTRDRGHLTTIRQFHQHLVDLKIDHSYIELENLAHKRTEMMATLEPVWFQYHVGSLKRHGVIQAAR